MAVSTLMPPPNDTCDIYHGANAPPAAPDVAGVKVFIKPNFGNIKPASVAFGYTHVFFLPLNTDVRDNWPVNTTGDALYVPDKNSNCFFVVAFVERVRLDAKGGNDYLRAYVNMSGSIVGPTQEG
jgi:hypothetical protein